MVRELNTVAEVVAELGGPEVVRDLTKCKSASIIPVWKHRKQFPAYTYPAIQDALAAKGATARKTLWKLERSA